MGVFWDLGLDASNESDAEKIKKYAKELLAYIDYIAQQGFEVSHNEAECSLNWKYDRISETEKCNSVLQHISKQLPQVELICYKNEWKNGAPEISEYCIMMNGDGEWKEADDTMIDLAEKCVYGIGKTGITHL